MILAIENDLQAISYVSYLLRINICNAFSFLSSIPVRDISKVPVALEGLGSRSRASVEVTRPVPVGQWCYAGTNPCRRRALMT
jgi:hypothetical protein